MNFAYKCVIVLRDVNISVVSSFAVNVAGNSAERQDSIEHPPTVTVLVLYEWTPRVPSAGSTIYVMCAHHTARYLCATITSCLSVHGGLCEELRGFKTVAFYLREQV